MLKYNKKGTKTKKEAFASFFMVISGCIFSETYKSSTHTTDALPNSRMPFDWD